MIITQNITSLLILDLDDTIFKTKSMNPKIFDSALLVIKNYYLSVEPEVDSAALIAELWSQPIDDVFFRYNRFIQIVEADINTEMKTELCENYNN